MQLSKIKEFVQADMSTIEKIDKMLEASVMDSSSRKPSNKPSSLGYKCLRKIYYSYFRVVPDKPLSAHILKIFRTGDIFERLILEWLQKIGEFVPYRNRSNGQIPKHFLTEDVDTQFPIKSSRWKIRKGKIDNIAVIKGDIWIYEIKSMNSSRFSKLDMPLDEHLVQVAIYFQTFNDLYLEGEYDHIPEIIGKGKAKGVKLLYINKDTSQIKEFVLTEKQLIPIILDTDKKILKVNGYIDSKTLPPKTPDMCSHCDWQEKCKANWNNV